jgi:hypothetical protein
LQKNTDAGRAGARADSAQIMKKLALIVVLMAVVAITPAAAASPTVRMTIIHVVEGCHMWGTNSSQPLGPTRKISLARGSKLVIRDNCTMSFDFSQVAGPKLNLGDPRTYPGTTRTIVFRKAGLYRLKARNVESSADMGLQTLGPDNTLVLTVRVHK